MLTKFKYIIFLFTFLFIIIYFASALQHNVNIGNMERAFV